MWGKGACLGVGGEGVANIDEINIRNEFIFWQNSFGSVSSRAAPSASVPRALFIPPPLSPPTSCSFYSNSFCSVFSPPTTSLPLSGLSPPPSLLLSLPLSRPLSSGVARPFQSSLPLSVNSASSVSSRCSGQSEADEGSRHFWCCGTRVESRFGRFIFFSD